MEIKLDKTYPLIWDIDAMIRFEETTGKNCFEIDKSTETTMQKLWAMLKATDPEITLEKTKELVFKYRREAGTMGIMCTVIDAVNYGQYCPNAEAPAVEKSTNS
jgi:hypothetical protein